MKMNMLNEKVIAVMNEVDFSGNVLVKRNNDSLQQHSIGFANRTHSILNNEQTRFGIASGCKIFTAVAICQLVEKGQLSFESKLSDILDIPFPTYSGDPGLL